MSDEFESINSRIPDLQSAIVQRIAARAADANPTNPPPGTVDPYELMMKRKQEKNIDTKVSPIQKWPEREVKILEDYCQKMGIVGFNCGKMPPLVALAMLKKQFGDDFTDVPLEQRVPEGYEKLGVHSKYGPNYPYSQAVSKKQILHD